MNAVVQKVNWSDNPWFPQVLRDEKDDLKARDMDAYLNVWEGNTRQVLDGAVYATELRKAQEENRIRDIFVAEEFKPRCCRIGVTHSLPSTNPL